MEIVNLNSKNSLYYKTRKKRIKYLVNFIQSILKRENLSTLRIGDIGGTFLYWEMFPFEKFLNIKFEITLINIEEYKFFEFHKEKGERYDNVKFFTLVGDACDLHHISDNAFDIAHSNSVIEHVGNWQRIKQFAREVKRVAKYYYIQTPNYWFFMEPHHVLPFVHWFPRPLHTKLLMKLKKFDYDKATTMFEQNRMLSKNEFRFLFKDSHLIVEKFYLFPKSFIVININ